MGFLSIKIHTLWMWACELAKLKTDRQSSHVEWPRQLIVSIDSTACPLDSHRIVLRHSDDACLSHFLRFTTIADGKTKDKEKTLSQASAHFIKVKDA